VIGRELERQLTGMVIAGSFSGLLAVAGTAGGRGGAAVGTEGSENLMSIAILI
jgi:hypothetical protein